MKKETPKSKTTKAKVTTKAKPKEKLKTLKEIKAEMLFEAEEALIEGLTPLDLPELPSRGLGDTVSKIAKFFGIEECEPCKKRKDAWNKMFPYLKVQKDFTKAQLELMDRLTASHIVNPEDHNQLFITYNEIFGTRLEKCLCPGLVSQLIERLNNCRKF